MKIFVKKKDLADYLGKFRKSATIGFVPTMGALHSGHLSLLRIAAVQSDIVVCSIFVNPTQFSDAGDLERYPRPIEADIEKLKKIQCDVLFLPEIDEMYSKNEEWHMDLGELERKLEGVYRPGHYQGVTQIVKKLLDVIQPDLVFLGQKDYQQYLVISKMVKALRMPLRLVMCPIVRDKDGLALSSRNIHLSDRERKQALVLHKVLNLTKKNFNKISIQQLKADAKALLDKDSGVVPEYFEICDARDLSFLKSKRNKAVIVLAAARVGSTRLIDNIILK